MTNDTTRMAHAARAHNREQSKFRDFFTKELNAIKTEHAKVEKQVAKLEKKSERNDDKKESLAQGIRFLKKIPAKSTAAGTTKKN
jgi:hypothetical protein